MTSSQCPGSSQGPVGGCRPRRRVLESSVGARQARRPDQVAGSAASPARPSRRRVRSIVEKARAPPAVRDQARGDGRPIPDDPPVTRQRRFRVGGLARGPRSCPHRTPGQADGSAATRATARRSRAPLRLPWLMAGVAIVTDTSSDLLPDEAAAAGIRLVASQRQLRRRDVRGAYRAEQRGLLRTPDHSRHAAAPDGRSQSGPF